MAPALDGDRSLGRPTPHPQLPISGRSSPMPLVSLTRTLVDEALVNSSDDGATLDFSHKNIVDVGELGAEELAQVGRGQDLVDESSVLRIALVGNRLATLPTAFALLSRLRYLTLRSNSFSVFPEVLTIMPSLEILDFSRNRIKRLPTNPGSLVNLRVLSLTRNKLQRLPSYFAKFRSLSVLKIAHNPIEWPPRSVVDTNEDLDDPEAMQNWLSRLKLWLSDNSHNDAYSVNGQRPNDIGNRSRSESSNTETSLEESLHSWSSSMSRDDEFDAGVTPHARSFSIDSQVSIYSSSSLAPVDEIPKTEKLPPLQLGFLPPSGPPSMTESPEAYLPTPDDSLTTAEDDATRAMYDAQQVQEKQHLRNASYAYEGFAGSRNASLTMKKSLPDLRNVRIPMMSSHTLPIQPKVPPQSSMPNGIVEDGYPPSPTIRTVNPTFVPPEIKPLRLRSNSKTTRPEIDLGSSSPPKPVERSPTKVVERPAPSMDGERNSYFRRLSTLPSSSIAATIPSALLTVVDSVRGILFATSQIYQTLQHYTVYAIDERLSSVLLKVLDPAAKYMSQLINALDRFDSTSRGALPPPAVCRAVVERCRDNVSVFGKAVGVLALQLKVLAMRDDVRYTRQMLLTLYGAMAEISNSWQQMAPHLEAVEPLLRESRPPPPVPPLQSKTLLTSLNRAPIQSISEQPESQRSRSPIPASLTATSQPQPIQSTSTLFPPAATPSVIRSYSAQPHASTSILPIGKITRSRSANPPPQIPPMPPSSLPREKEVRTRMNRRHAGSFSVKDVQIGKALPSNSDVVSPTRGVVSGTASTTPTPRIGVRLPTPTAAPPMPAFPASTSSAANAASSSSSLLTHSHLRQDSQTLFPGSSPVPSPPVPRHMNNLLDVPNSTTLVDKEAIDAMDGAVRAAPAVWSMLEEILSDMPDTTLDLHESLAKAQAVTSKLRDNIRAVQEDHHSANRKALREDAHVFVRTVVQLSNVVKTYDSTHRLSAQLRKDIAKLTNATQEFVMLLHVSSFSPSSTPRPYSPMLNGNTSGAQAAAQANALNQIAAEEAKHGLLSTNGAAGNGINGGGGANLSRSRSAQPPSTLRVMSPVVKAVPRSALPHQTFKIPPAPRMMGTRMRIAEDALDGQP
ncbi:hypothetical protein BD410DRAFT_785409 [Rickenella mellea]|uniref:Uncharacterized protein n=1 Tax=Rickenella mellea TaxID=50990 RepID=A0A4Y7QAL0_9AGAM|nr:hypothetical protein BD410DRAFT_785409 [Rickenella mellea]